MYKKGEKLDISKWILVKMYKDRSLIPFENQIDSYDDSITKQENGNFYIKELYDHFLHIAGVYSLMLDENDTKIVKPLSFMLADTIVADNKCVFEILNIETGEKLYVGMIDGRYTIGDAVWSEFGNYYKYGFIKNV